MKNNYFRGKDMNTQSYIYGSYYSPFDGMHQIIHKIPTNLTQITEVYEDSVGVFTGVYDKLGNEIFEGDKFIINDQIWVVEYNNDMCRFIVTSGFGYDSKNAFDLNIDVASDMTIYDGE